MPKGDALEMDGTVIDTMRNSQFTVRLVARTGELPLPVSRRAIYRELRRSMSRTFDHKVSVSPLLPGVSVSFNAQPYGGFHVVVFSSTDNAPSELYAGLRAVGFTSRGPVPQPTGVARQSFGRDGSALLGGWTGPERERFLAEARRTLRRFGFTFVPEVPYLQSAPR